MKAMRRADRLMHADESQKLLTNGEYGILSTTDAHGQPYATPLNYVYWNDSIYFHCATTGAKLDNIRTNDKVCFTIVGKTKVLPDQFATNYESVMAFGVASQVDGPEKLDALEALIQKYSPEYIPQGKEYIERAKDKTVVIRITIDHCTGKRR